MTTSLVSDMATDLYVGGQWLTAEDGARVSVTDPATGEPFCEVAAAGRNDMLAAVAAADAAAAGWAATAPRDRGEVLRRAFELLTGEAERFAALIVRENGKSFRDAHGEVAYAAEFLRWYSEEAVRLEQGLMRSPSGSHRILSLLQPVGVSLLVTPWNFPAAMGTRKIAPALAAGCTVIAKPASETPLTMLALADLLERAGVPAGVVNVLTARSSSEVVSAALEDPRVRALSFTGSTEVGSLLLAKAAERVVNCSMELGGNAPFVVFEDADLDVAVEGAVIAKMRNGGASCIAANRFLVAESVASAFTERLAAALGDLEVGPGTDPQARVGPLVSAKERDRVAELVELSTDRGAQVSVGGRVPQRPGWYYQPTVLAEMGSDAPIFSQEIFGPVAPITTFATEDEVIEVANATEHGLAAYVFTSDLARGLRVSEAIEAGIIGLNRGFVSDPAAPFGGMKQSGIGREGGRHGLLEFCETKYVAADW